MAAGVAPELPQDGGEAEPMAGSPPVASESANQAMPSTRGSLPAIAPIGSLALLDGTGDVRPLDDIEAETIRFAIAHYRGQMSEVARRLGIGRSTLYRKLDSLGLTDAATDVDSSAL